MQDDIGEAALAGVHHFRYAPDAGALAVGHVLHPEAPGLLGDQQAAIGQEGHRPRLVEARHFDRAERPVRGRRRLRGGGGTGHEERGREQAEGRTAHGVASGNGWKGIRSYAAHVTPP